MYSKLLTIICIFSFYASFAQNKDANAQKKDNNPQPVKIDYTLVGAPMPELVMFNMDTAQKNSAPKQEANSKKHKKAPAPKSPYVTNEDLKSDANLLVMEFNPTCSHCVDQTELLKKNMDLFKKTKLVMLADARIKELIADFVKQRNIHDFPSIYIGFDTGKYMSETFLYRNLPQIDVYSPCDPATGERKLLRVFNGEAPIDSLRQYIQ